MALYMQLTSQALSKKNGASEKAGTTLQVEIRGQLGHYGLQKKREAGGRRTRRKERFGREARLGGQWRSWILPGPVSSPLQSPQHPVNPKGCPEWEKTRDPFLLDFARTFMTHYLVCPKHMFYYMRKKNFG
jgi:hypothetical protein